MKSYPVAAAAAFLASTHHRLGYGDPRSIPHLCSQHQDCMTQKGGGLEGACCSRGWTSPGDAPSWGSWPTQRPATTRENRGPGLNWPSSSNDAPSLQLCFVLFHSFFRPQIRWCKHAARAAAYDYNSSLVNGKQWSLIRRTATAMKGEAQWSDPSTPNVITLCTLKN